MTQFRKRISVPLFAGYLLLSISAFAAGGDMALVGGKVYPSPSAQPIDDATVLVQAGKIVAVGRRTEVSVPKTLPVVNCWGKVIVAGFWNSHVHFETGWHDAAKAPADKLEAHMQEMLTRWGVTTVWDLGSNGDNTQALRRRIEAGEVPGPRILMAGDIFPKNGHPAYLPPEMPTPEAATPQEAAQMAQGYMDTGFDGVKLFTGSYMGNKPVVNMDAAIVKAAVDVAHAQSKPVFVHPQNRVGLDNALKGGVDILAHTNPWEGSYTPEELAEMKQHHVALIPTLMEWTTIVSDPAVAERLVQAGVDEVKQYTSQGGMILFGTDGGFQAGYDPTQEFEFMGRALGWHDILASLTTNPAEFFKATNSGRVEQGMDADLVVLNGDPASDVRHFAHVAYTIRAGKVIYGR
jgi:imidazolonepropionase-like amidohydrolase